MIDLRYMHKTNYNWKKDLFFAIIAQFESKLGKTVG